jgi:hypothetical protein
MARYHINPQTGNPNVCTAKVKCKFTSEDGVIPAHYETQAEAEKAAEAQSKKTVQAKPKAQAKIPAKKQSEKPAEVKAEAKLPTVETPVKALPKTVEVLPATQTLSNTLENNTSEDKDELRVSENLEKAIKFARKLDNSIALKRPIYRAKLKGLRKKAFSFIKLAPRPKALKK